jgi:hypothetical protein
VRPTYQTVGLIAGWPGLQDDATGCWRLMSRTRTPLVLLVLLAAAAQGKHRCLLRSISVNDPTSDPIYMPTVSNGLIGAIHGQPAEKYNDAVILWMASAGGCGLDTALQYRDQHKIGTAIKRIRMFDNVSTCHAHRNFRPTPNGALAAVAPCLFLTTKIPCMENGTAESALALAKEDVARLVISTSRNHTRKACQRQNVPNSLNTVGNLSMPRSLSLALLSSRIS